MSDVTLILESIDQGDPEAAAQLLPLVYEELRKVAAQQLVREKPGQTLDPTALVHEAYLRLLGPDGAAHFHNRQHFFGAAAQAMRRILIENARRKGRAKRGGDRRREHVALDELSVDSSPRELLILNEVLERFARHDSVKAKLVELRFFGGLTLEQAAECLEISLSTAERSWRYARAWLYTAMSSGEFEKI
jgi:RNA polymerase sigma factor (TIGR02999 family)